MLYLRIGNSFAMLADMDRRYGFSPCLSFISCKGETIVDIPFIRVIITPARRLHGERDSNAEQQSAPVFKNSERTPENRSGVPFAIRRMPCSHIHE
jgi:hypothetical protein